MLSTLPRSAFKFLLYFPWCANGPSPVEVVGGEQALFLLKSEAGRMVPFSKTNEVPGTPEERRRETERWEWGRKGKEKGERER